LEGNQGVRSHGIHFTTGRDDEIGIEMHRGKGGRAQRLIKNSEFSGLGDEISRVNIALAEATARYVKKVHPQLVGLSKGLADLEAIFLKSSETKSDGLTKDPS
jgi:hypothetical protein